MDLGCGKGEAGAAFRRLQPEADYWGFETSKPAVHEAASRLPHAVYAQPELLDFDAYGLREADVLVIRGEYLRGLDAARLRGLSRLVPDDGQVLLAIPNAAYVRNLLDMLAGRGSEAWMCPALPHWRQIITQAGFQSVSIYPYGSRAGKDGTDKTLKESAGMQKLLASLADLCREQGLSAPPDIWVEGWVLRLSRRRFPRESRMIIHTVLGEALVTAPVRIREPGSFLQTEPGLRAVEEVHHYEEKLDRDFGQVIFIRQRMFYSDFSQGWSIIQEMRRRGHVIVAEMDDNPRLWDENGAQKHTSLDYMGTHAVQVSTKALAEVMLNYNPEVAIFPNQLRELPELRDYGAEARAALQGLGESADDLARAPVTIFFGALNREKEWQEIMPVLNEAAARYGERLRFKVLSDKKFFQELASEHKEFLGDKSYYDGVFVPYQVYQRALHGSDISLLPLHDTAFNRTKSDLKFIESAGHGAVALASPIVYADTIKDGRNGFIYHDVRQFAQYLELLIENRERRLETAAAAYHYVRRERLLCQHYMERLAWYKDLWARRGELDKGLQERLARLRRDEERKAKET